MRETAAWLESLTLDTVIVHTKTGRSFKGLLVASYSDSVVLRDVLDMDSEVMLEGEIGVFRGNVDFMQRIGGASDHTSDG